MWIREFSVCKASAAPVGLFLGSNKGFIGAVPNIQFGPSSELVVPVIVEDMRLFALNFVFKNRFGLRFNQPLAGTI